jgi:hypothetical protein
MRNWMDERGDEVLGSRLLGDLVVVVDDEPPVRGPGGEILAQDLGERVDVLGWRRKRPQMLAQTMVTALDEGGRAPRDAERQRSDVGRRRPRCEPHSNSTVTRDPLLGQRRLPVAGGRDEHPHTRPGLVQKRIQTRALDDPALADPYFGDCRRRRRLP